MANRKLNSIKFPDIADTYILDADKVNFDDSETYASGSVGKALQNKANIDGSYSDLTAGNAEQLVSNVKVNDKTPYLFRTSGGSVDIGDREYVNGIVGGTVAWNQLAEHFQIASTYSGVTRSATASDGSITITGTLGSNRNAYLAFNAIANHKYLILLNNKVVTSGDVILLRGYSEVANLTSKDSIIVAPATDVTYRLATGATASVVYDQTYIPQMFDLTQMFGSTIADYIYSLETATAGAGVAWFKKLFNKPYYAYNAGELKSVSGLVSHDMTGFNQWDEEWEVGAYNTSTGAKESNNTTIRCKNKIRVIPNATYYVAPSDYTIRIFFYDANGDYLNSSVVVNAGRTFTTPSDAGYITFHVASLTTYNHDICINIAWDNSRNGEYEPYELHSYPLDSDLTLRGIPKLDANNGLYYDGDIYPPSGEVARKYGIRAYQSGDESLADAITDGTNTVYKLTTPTTETADPYTSPQIVDDFGTEEYVISDNTFAVPVGTDTDYPINMVAKLEMAPNSPDGDGTYVVKQTNGMNEYVPLIIPSGIPAVPSENGSYTLTATVADGTTTLSWEAE